MSESNTENLINNFDTLMENIENTMTEIQFLKQQKKDMNEFIIKFLLFVIIVNHFHVLVDTNYSILSTVYECINLYNEIEVEKSKDTIEFYEIDESDMIEDVD